MARPVIILFAKAPRLGQVKRRLAAELGEAAALRLYRNMLFATLRKLERLGNYQRILAITPDAARLRLPAGWQCIGQGRGDLGQRMDAAFRRLPRRQVVLVGADIPGLGPADIRTATLHAPAFGPAADGGYYLVAMAGRRPARPFANVRWSSPYALADTLKNFTAVHKLRVLHDVDTAKEVGIVPSTAQNPN